MNSFMEVFNRIKEMPVDENISYMSLGHDNATIGMAWHFSEADSESVRSSVFRIARHFGCRTMRRDKSLPQRLLMEVSDGLTIYIEGFPTTYKVVCKEVRECSAVFEDGREVPLHEVAEDVPPMPAADLHSEAPK